RAFGSIGLNSRFWADAVEAEASTAPAATTAAANSRRIAFPPFADPIGRRKAADHTTGGGHVNEIPTVRASFGRWPDGHFFSPPSPGGHLANDDQRSELF